MGQSEPKRTKLFILLSALPALFLAAQISKHGVNFIYWDEWENVSLFEKISKGLPFLGDLFGQQVESRMVLMRLGVLAISYMTHWNVRYEMAFSFSLLCLISYGVYRLGRMTVSGGALTPAALIFISNFLLFSPIQAYNVLTGHQMAVFMPPACFIWALVMVYSDKVGLAAKYIGCMILCAAATFSMGTGMVSWALILPMLVIAGLKSNDDAGKVKILSAVWLLWAALNIWAYFFNYRTPPPGAAASFGDVFVKPAAAAQYLIAYIGSPIFYSGVDDTAIAGLIGMLLWIAVVVAIIRRRGSGPSQLYNAAPWIMTGVYALLGGCLITLGRFGWSMNAPLPPTRYTTFSMFFAVSLIYLAAIYFNGAGGTNAAQRPGWVNRAGIIFLILFLYMQNQTYRSGAAEMDDLQKDRLKGKTYLLFMHVLENKQGLDKFVYPDMGIKKEAALYIDKLGLIDPPLIKSNLIKDIEGRAAPGADCGYFSRLIDNKDGTYTACGWASLPWLSRPADAVVLAYSEAGAPAVMFGLTCDIGRSASYRNQFRRDSVWEIVFPASKLPRGTAAISAWGFDADSGRAFKLNNEQTVGI